MKKYFLFAWLSFLNLIEYRMNFLWEIFGSLITMLMLYAFWVAVLGSGFAGGHYTPISIGLYYLFITFLDAITHSNYWRIANLINSGDLSMEIAKPYSFFIKEFVQSIPHKFIQSLIFLGLFFAFFIFGIKHDFSVLQVILFIMASILAITGKFFISLILGGLGFWFKRVHGFGSLFWNLGGLFSGDLIPVDLLPGLLLSISIYLPFRYLAFFPVQIIIGKIDIASIFKGLGVQILWILFFIYISQLVWKKGLAQYDASGR